MNRDATYHLYGQLPRSKSSFDWPETCPDPEPVRFAGTVFVAEVGPHPWRFVESLRAVAARNAYDEVRRRHPELDGLPLRVDGPGGFHEEGGR